MHSHERRHTLSTDAPGKFFIAGEYAVLFGEQAIVGVSAQRARCQFTPDSTTQFAALAHNIPLDSSLCYAVVAICEQYGITPQTGRYDINTSDFFDAHTLQKLGLGSSAAATVALAKMVFLQNGLHDQQRLFAICLKAHALFSGGVGSGADVAASIVGEPILFQRGEDLPLVQPLRSSLFFSDLMIITTGHAQSTRDLVKQLLANQATIERELTMFCHDARVAGQKMLHAPCEIDFINAMDDAYKALYTLGTHANMNIVTDEHARLHECARAFGGSAKPSGAGGGDIAIAYIPAKHREGFLERLRSSF